MAKYNVEFDYFHDYESEQFAFYRIPKVLFTDDYFRNLSSDAKVLYGLMLDRMALSIKNRWIDEDNRVYIIFSLEQVMKYMNCGRDKGMKTLAELDTKKGIGLIERVKQGFGKPDIIYVKSFVLKKKPEPMEPETDSGELQFDEVGNADLSQSEKPTCRGRKNRPNVVDKTDLSWSEKPTYRGRECRSTEVGKTDPNYTYYNNTDLSDNDMNNINLINPSGEVTEKQADRMDGMDVINAYTAIVKENIDYDVLIQGCRLGDKEYIDEIVELMAETISFKRENMSIGNVEYPYQFVKNKLLKVESSHIQYVLECLHDNTTKIRKYETGRRKPKLEQLKKIAGGLEISVIEFLDIEIENEADLIAAMKKISPFFQWEGFKGILGER